MKHPDRSRSLLAKHQSVPECESEGFIKGTTYSLFGTISALKKMKHNDSDFHFEYVLGSKSAEAFHQNDKISALDSIADLYLVFNEDLTDRQKMTFYDQLHHELDRILDNVARFGWNTEDTHSSSSKFQSLWVQALRESEGYSNIYILSHDDPNLFPIQKGMKWAVYNDFEVNIAAKYEDKVEENDHSDNGANTLMLELTEEERVFGELNFGDDDVSLTMEERLDRLEFIDHLNDQSQDSLSDLMEDDINRLSIEPLDCPNVANETIGQWIDDIQWRYEQAPILKVDTEIDTVTNEGEDVQVQLQDPCLLPSMVFFLLLVAVGYGVVMMVYRKYRRFSRRTSALSRWSTRPVSGPQYREV